MGERNQPPNHREEQPRPDKAERKHQQRPPPLGIHERREDVLQEPQVLLRNLGRRNVALAVLQNGPLAVLPGRSGPEGATPVEKMFEKLTKFNQN